MRNLGVSFKNITDKILRCLRRGSSFCIFGCFCIFFGYQLNAQSAGYALSFDGSDDYVNCDDGASLDMTSSITVEAWIKPSSSADSRIVNNWDGGGGGNRAYMLTTTSSKFQLYLSSDGSTGTDVIDIDAYSVGKWQHVAGT